MSVAPDLMDLLGTEALPPRAPDQAVATSLNTSAVVARDVAFEGASRLDQLGMWGPLLRSADDEILPEKPDLDARSRDMVRNDAYISGSQRLRQDNIVGSIYLLNARPNSAVLFGSEDEQWETEFQEEVETKFTLWAESDQCWVDAQRTKTFTDIIRLAVGVHLAGGEVLGASEWMPDDGRPFRTAFQMVDTDRLSTPLNRAYAPANKIRGGVERDKNGAPIAYHIRMGHPSDYANPDSYQWRRVMARKPWGRTNILHIYDQVRADQTRGISNMVSALQEMKMMKSFRKSELQRAVLAATYAASIESELPHPDVFRMMGGDDAGTDPSLAWVQSYLEAINEYSGGGKNLVINGVRMPVMMPGTKLNIKNPGAESPQGDKFEMSGLRYLAAALDLSYEQLSRDYTNTNYSSSRASRGETEKGMASKKRKVADGTANLIYRNWLEEAINNNQIECLKRRKVPGFYEGLNAEAYTQADWIGAGFGLLDPLKETQAYLLQNKSGYTTKESIIARINGGDWRKVARQIKRERELDEKLGNPSVYDDQATQDMQNSLSGSPRDGSQQ